MSIYDAMPSHDRRQLPMFTLREIDLPEIRKWEVNGSYYLIMKVEQVSVRNRKDMDAPDSDRSKLEADFQVMSIKALGDKPVDRKTLEQRDFERVVAKAKSGEV